MRTFRAPYTAVVAPAAYDAGDIYRERQRTQRAMPTPFVQAVSANLTLTAQDDSGWFLVDATAAAVTLTLPLASAAPAMTVTVKKTDSSAHTVTVARSGTNTIDGAASVVISAQYGAIVLRSDGSAAWDLLTPAAAGTATKVGHSLTAGTHLTGGPFDGSANVTLATDAVSTNTISTLVARDINGDFAARIVTADLVGNASTATSATTATTATTATQVGHSLSAGTYLSGTAFNGSSAQTWAAQGTSANTASWLVARDASGNFSAGTITAALSGNAATASVGAQLTAAAAVANAMGNVAASGAAQQSIAAAGGAIYGPSADYGQFLLVVSGKDAATGTLMSNSFLDLVTWNPFAGSPPGPQTMASTNTYGTPGARTYTKNGSGQVVVAVASGTTWYIDLWVLKFDH